MNNDLISREALKKRLQENHDFFLKAWDNSIVNMSKEDKARLDEISQCIAEVVNAPTVEPKKGYWIDICTLPGMVQCLHCGVVLSAAENIDVNFNFCPNCGADMKGGTEND